METAPTRDVAREVGGRTPQACDACRRSKTKCSGTRPQCRRCLKRKTPCTWPGIPSSSFPAPGTPESLPSDSVQAQTAEAQGQAAQISPIHGFNSPVGVAAASLTLPPRLLDIFLERHHEVEFCAFLHKPTTTMAGLQKQAPVLAMAIASLAALYLKPDERERLTSSLGLPSCTVGLSDFYAQQASLLGRHLTDQPSIYTIQAFLVLAVRELIAWKDFKAWMHAGTALRMAHALQLGVELDADQQSPFSVTRRQVGPRQRETRRRTFWACFVVDRLISYTCHHRFYIELPPVIPAGVASNVIYGTRGGGEDVRLPCAENTFTYDENDPGPWLNEFMSGQTPQHLQQLSRMSATPFYLCMLRLWGDMALLHATGGRRRTPYGPTDPAGPFFKTNQAIAEFSTQVVPPAMHWSAANYRLHKLTGQAQTFVQFNFLLHHARCVMHHEYLPQLDMQYYSPMDNGSMSGASGSGSGSGSGNSSDAIDLDMGLGSIDYRTLMMGSDAAGLPQDYSNKPLIDTCIDAINTITDMASELFHGSGGSGDDSTSTPEGDLDSERARGRAILQSTVAANALMTAAAVHLWVVYTQTCDKCPKPVARAKFLLLLGIIQSWEPRWPVAAAWGQTLGLLYKLYEYSYGTEPVPEFVSWEAEGEASPAIGGGTTADNIDTANWRDGESSACRDHPGLSYGDVLPDPTAVGQSLHDKVRSILVHPLHAPDVKRRNLRVFSQTLWQQSLWLLPDLLGTGPPNDGLNAENLYM